MRFFAKFTVLALAMTLLPYSGQAKDKGDDNVYAFGFSQNFNDSTIYLTSIQELPGATLTKREKFLEHRNEYGIQLKEYLESTYEGHETCAIFFSKKKKSLEKKYIKVRRHLLRQKQNKLIEIPSKEFQFQRLSFRDE